MLFQRSQAADPQDRKIQPSLWKKRGLASILILFVCFGGYYLGNFAAIGLNQKGADQKLQSINGLYIDPASLDFGEAWETPCHNLTLAVQNIGDTPRTIVGFTGACGCLDVEPERLTILPGETADLSVKIDLTRRPYQVGVSQWPVSLRFLPVFEGDFAPSLGWELKGRVRSRVSLESMYIFFMDQCIHGGPSVTRKVRARVYVPLDRLEVVAVPNIAVVRVEPIANSLDQFQILVSPHPQLPKGPFSFEVKVRGVTSDGEIHSCASLQASGEMQPSTRIFPRLILLGELCLSAQAVADISVQLPANGWIIDHIETDDPDTTVARTGVELDRLVNLRLTQRISQLGDQVAQVRIIIRKPDKQVEVLKVEARYHGLPQLRPSKTPGVPSKQLKEVWHAIPML